MKKFILPFLSIFFTLGASGLLHTRAVQGSEIDCFTEAIPDILDKSNESNFRQITNVKASVQQMYSEYDYPKLPENFEKILGGTTRNLCSIIGDGDNASMFYKDFVDRVKRYYKEGDHKDFFYKHFLTLKCQPGYLNFYDWMLENPSRMRTLYGSVMRGMFDGINPNAFIRIKREGKIFEGPIHLVYQHLSTNYKNSPNYRHEYLGIMKRIKRSNYISEEPKSIAEIRRGDPKMPLTLP